MAFLFVIIKHDNEKGHPKDQNIQSLPANQQGKCDYTVFRIKGKWLKDFGFTQGQNICIQAADKKLVITVEEAI